MSETEQTMVVPPPEATSNVSEEQRQQWRAELRERTVRFYLKMADVRADIHMCENTETGLPCVFRAIDAKEENVQVSELQTMIGTYPEALVRMNDIAYMELHTSDPKVQNR